MAEAAAASFVSQISRPCLKKALLMSHTSGGFWLGGLDHLPKSLSKEKMQMAFEYKGQHWPVVYIPQNRGFSGGWRLFSVDNGLKAGDAVVFEVIDEGRMKVYIFRARDFASGAGPLPELYEDAPEIDYKGRADVVTVADRKVGETCRGSKVKRELLEGVSPQVVKKEHTVKLSEVSAKMKARGGSKEHTDVDHVVTRKKMLKRTRRLTEVGEAKAVLPAVHKKSKSAPASPCPSGSSLKDSEIFQEIFPDEPCDQTEFMEPPVSVIALELRQPTSNKTNIIPHRVDGCSLHKVDVEEAAMEALVEEEPSCSPMVEDAQEQAEAEAFVQPLREDLGCGRTSEEAEFNLKPSDLIAGLLEQQETLRSACLVFKNQQFMNASTGLSFKGSKSCAWSQEGSSGYKLVPLLL